MMAPLHAAYAASSEWQDITLKAYPPPEKKVKKVKDRGTRFPIQGKAGEKATEEKTGEEQAAAAPEAEKPQPSA